ncbi:MAG: GTP cyclohydrolase FolE2 [Kiritimatiellia bacterium]
MHDTQNERDNRRIPINKVGIKHLVYPIMVLDRENKTQPTVADISLYVDLPHHYKGTHMSRFVEVVNEHRGLVSLRSIEAILGSIVERFDSLTAHLEIRFPYFVEKSAPVSGARSLMNYNCAFLASLDRRARRRAAMDLIVEVAVPVATLCPCSKDISSAGAHNQRSQVIIRTRSAALVWIEELIGLAEDSASSGLYALLKRADEKHVTEHAYQHPRFAEDVARMVAQRLCADKRVIWFQVESENSESIHNHNAYAMIEGAGPAAQRRRKRP